MIMKMLLILLIPLFSLNIYCQSKYSETIDYLKNKGYKISADQYADLKQGGSASYTKTFYEGTTYMIVGLSDDNDVQDVDIYLKRMDGTDYDKDTDTERIAVVQFSPTFTREMKKLLFSHS